MRLWDRSYPAAEVRRRVGTFDQVAGVRLVTLSDGSERGVRVLEFRTGGGLSFDVVVDRCMDIGRCEWRGVPLSWLSSTGWPGPWFREPQGLGFLRTFGGGLLTTCGLDHALFPASDTAAQYHYPPWTTEDYGLHGRASTIPARLTGYGERWEGDEMVLWATGEVVQTSALGENLVLTRRIEARAGSPAIQISDEVTNRGYATTPHMCLYHVNVGFPVLDEGAQIVAPVSTVEPAGDYPEAGHDVMDPPTPGYEERVFQYSLHAEAGGTVPVALVNRGLGLGFYQVFRQDQLPFHFVWRMLGEGAYVLALEPCTNRPAGRLDARERGELIELAPGESRQYSLELGALTDGADIERFEARVAAARESR